MPGGVVAGLALGAEISALKLTEQASGGPFSKKHCSLISTDTPLNLPTVALRVPKVVSSLFPTRCTPG